MRKLVGLISIILVVLLFSPVHAALVSYNYSGNLYPTGGAAWDALQQTPPNLATFSGEFTYENASTPDTNGYYLLKTLTFVPELPSLATSLEMDDEYGSAALNTSGSNFALFNPTTVKLFLGVVYSEQSYALGITHVIYDYYSSNSEYGNLEVSSILLNDNGGNPVPEPATMLLLASGLVGLAGFRKRFKK